MLLISLMLGMIGQPPSDDLSRRDCLNINVPAEVRIERCNQYIASGLDGRDLAVAYFNRAGARLSASQFQAAVDDYTRVIKIEPKLSDAYENRAIAFKRLHRMREALRDYNEAVRLDPQNARYYYNRGRYSEEAANEPAAIIDYGHAIALKENYVEAYTARGRAYILVRHFDAALADFNQAIRFNPRFAPAYAGRAVVWQNKGDSEKARRDNEQALSLGWDPSSECPSKSCLRAVPR